MVTTLEKIDQRAQEPLTAIKSTNILAHPGAHVHKGTQKSARGSEL